MSENIRGITFAEQAVTPADDAIVRRALLGDGILTGCEISYSGSTLTMAAGYIIACGRSFQITTAQNWAVVDATSGVARLVLTIDLTKTATENAFNQIDFAVEYASAEDGFADLVQEDINISGTKYQIVAAVVSLGTGGITGIVSKLAQAEGGGGGLNFRVVPGLTQPGTAAENTIWVKTESLTGWYFAATQPENMQEGEVWFKTSTSSLYAFNALKQNKIMVYPIEAKQMVSGALKTVSVECYQEGKWVAGTPYLYNNGEIYSEWTRFNPGTRGDLFRNSLKFNSDHFQFTDTTDTNAAEAISWLADVTNYSKVIVEYDYDTGDVNSAGVWIGDSATTQWGGQASVSITNYHTNGKTTITLDVSQFTGNKYICIGCWGQLLNYLRVYSIKLE